MASHSEVAHRWAQDDQSARTLKGFNIFAEWDLAYNDYFAAGSQINVIFSHGRHFPIAAFVTTPKGERVVLANFHESRSNSTSKHQCHVRRAIPSRYPVFDVPHVAPQFKRGGSDHFHRDNLDELMKRAAAENGKAKRARIHKEFHNSRAASWLDMAGAYAAAFDLEWSPVGLDELAEEVARRDREQQAQYRKEREERAAKERERMVLLRVNQAGEMTDWYNGIGASVPSAYRVDDNGSAYVRRYRGRLSDLDVLQTSMGAEVPWEHALKVFKFIKLVRAKGEGWKRNGHVIRVGHYQVDSIDADGNMWAGCHYFTWSHMEALAKREGALDVAPNDSAVEARA